MKSLIRILILFVILYSWVAATKNRDLEICTNQQDKERPDSQFHLPMRYGEKYEVAFIQNAAAMYDGCAYMDHDWALSDTPLLHLWLEEQPSVSPVYCKDISNKNRYIFECLSNDKPTNKEEIDKGLHYMSLFEYTPDAYTQHFHKTNKLPYRCAVYVIDEFDHYDVVVIRMVLSKGRAERFDVSQCEGLSTILTNKDLLNDPAMQQNWPEGATYLFVMGDLQPKRSTTTEESSMTFYEMLNMIMGIIMPVTALRF
uniref:Uncharacterized protein n=1 Tax=Schizaphis graminum TaxID=13262 RepID=A0A2S2NV39_SCHGA